MSPLAVTLVILAGVGGIMLFTVVVVKSYQKMSEGGLVLGILGLALAGLVIGLMTGYQIWGMPA